MPWPESGVLAIPVKAIAGQLATPTSPAEERHQCFDFGLGVLLGLGMAASRQYPKLRAGDRDRPSLDERSGATTSLTVMPGKPGTGKPGTRAVRSNSPYRRDRAWWSAGVGDQPGPRPRRGRSG